VVGACLSGRRPWCLPPVRWRWLHAQPLPSTLLGLVSTSPCGLSHRTPLQCHPPLHLRGRPRLVWVVPLPLAAGPRGMPCPPHLDTSITGCLANRQAASAAWHSFTCQGLAAARAAAPSISWAPLLWDGLLFIPVARGLCPLAWLGGAGSDLPRCRCTWAMAPGEFLFIRGLSASLVRPSSEGLLSAAGAIQGALSPLFGGGFTVN
jgi:hypothetical protein